MTDFPAFLAARLEEQESWIKDQHAAQYGIPGFTQRFMLADIAAKRAILDDYRDVIAIEQKYSGKRGIWPAGAREAASRVPGLHAAIVILCRPFADHPDYPKSES